MEWHQSFILTGDTTTTMVSYENARKIELMASSTLQNTINIIWIHSIKSDHLPYLWKPNRKMAWTWALPHMGESVLWWVRRINKCLHLLPQKWWQGKSSRVHLSNKKFLLSTNKLDLKGCCLVLIFSKSSYWLNSHLFHFGKKKEKNFST